MKIKLLYFFLFFFSFSYSQNEINNILNQRKEIEISNDTTKIITNTIDIDLSFLCSKKYINPNIPYNHEYNVLNNHEFAVFQNSRKVNGKYLKLKQWSTPIVIFFDKKIPKTIIKNFKLFFFKINEIKNLSISYTSSKEKANYIILATDKKISAFSSKQSLKKDLKKELHPFYNLNYKLLTDNNNKFYSCILKINKDEFKKPNVALKKLKQIFFLSLGNFVLRNYKLKKSLLSRLYINQKNIFEHDINFLKIHYGLIYNKKVDEKDFRKLKKYANQQCKNN